MSRNRYASAYVVIQNQNDSWLRDDIGALCRLLFNVAESLTTTLKILHCSYNQCITPGT